MTPSDLDTNFIMLWMERGDIQTIAHELGVNESTVRNALRGRTKSFWIIEKCHDYIMVRVNKWIAMREQANILKQKIAAL